jgi:hypothetical protein
MKKIPYSIRVLAILAFIFGLMTIFKAGSVLFGPQSARDAVGNFVPFVLWFNFFAGFVYVATAVHIWLDRGCAMRGAIILTGATIVVALGFVWHASTGGSYEMQTVGALVLRIAFWAIASVLLVRRLKQRKAISANSKS